MRIQGIMKFYYDSQTKVCSPAQLCMVLGMLDKEIEGYLESRTFRRHSFHKVAHPGK